MRRQNTNNGQAEIHWIPNELDPDRPLTLTAALEHAEAALQGAGPLWIEAEIASWKVSRAGHSYVTLRDEHTSVEAVMYRGTLAALLDTPPNGSSALLLVWPSLYKTAGRFQLVIQRIEILHGEGLHRLALRRLKERLEAEGLFSQSRKRRLPPFPGRIAVVTSQGSAAWRDIVDVISRRSPWIELLLVPTRVEGYGAEAEIAAALRQAHSSVMADLLILTRGGGGEELRVFDSEMVVRAVAAATIPVVTAIGHAGDVTLADLVADLRAPTPSAAAELATPDQVEIRKWLDTIGNQLGSRIARIVNQAEAFAVSCRDTLEAGVSKQLRVTTLRLEVYNPERLHRGLERVVERWEERAKRASAEELERRTMLRIQSIASTLNRSKEQLYQAVATPVRLQEEKLRGASARLYALSPLAVIGRGYVVMENSRGDFVRSIHQVDEGEAGRVRVQDGWIGVVVQDVEMVAKGKVTSG